MVKLECPHNGRGLPCLKIPYKGWCWTPDNDFSRASVLLANITVLKQLYKWTDVGRINVNLPIEQQYAETGPVLCRGWWLGSHWPDGWLCCFNQRRPVFVWKYSGLSTENLNKKVSKIKHKYIIDILKLLASWIKNVVNLFNFTKYC